MKFFLLMLCAWACSLSVRADVDLAEVVKSGELWTLPQEQVHQKYLAGRLYSWLDEKKSQLRVRNGKKGVEKTSAGGLTFGELCPGEWMFNVKDGKYGSLAVVVYNKGDDGSLDKAAFEDKIRDTVQAVSAALGIEAKGGKVASKRESAVAERRWEWAWENGAVVMEAAATGGGKSRKARDGGNFQSEYIRLRMGADAQSIAVGGARDAESRSALRDCVVREDKRVYIDKIPMVDQGEKGYCVPATVSRVFSLYGMDGVDQHAMAALCGSSGEGGTSSAAMTEALESICRKYHVRISYLDGKKEKDMKKRYAWVDVYNKMARKEGMGELSLMQAVRLDADPGLLKEARASKKQTEAWMKPIRRSINGGAPVLWSVVLGLYPEPKRLDQSRGGHMRLIIGYDDEKKTVIYSDSWGAGHEMKELPVREAAAMTVGRYSLQLTK